jgi:ADP-ribose pyrophosphatase YjhB (NUDIX family)
MQLPGGHLEYGESFAETAAREVLEETGLEVGDIKFLTATNDVFGEGKHYITIFVTCVIVGEEKVAKVSLDPFPLNLCFEGFYSSVLLTSRQTAHGATQVRQVGVGAVEPDVDVGERAGAG